MKVVLVGSSAGGMKALPKLLRKLPAEACFPVVIAQHMQPESTGFCDILARSVGMTVREAEDKETMEPGIIYAAPADYHLMIEKDRSFSLSKDEKVTFSRPSIDVLFESAAQALGSDAVAIVLTGANNDGAAGAKWVQSQGGKVLVQDPREAEAKPMPRAAIKACPEAEVMTLDGLSQFLVNLNEEEST